MSSSDLLEDDFETAIGVLLPSIGRVSTLMDMACIDIPIHFIVAGKTDAFFEF